MPPSRPPVRALFVGPGEGSTSSWATIKASAADTGRALGLVVTTIPQGDSTPLHVHHDEDEAFYVLDGTVDFVCGQERFRAEAGALAFLPRGLPHTFLGVSDPGARVLILLLPGGLEELFTQTDPARLDQMLRDHHVQIVGPALTT